jgi:hypothetical protein
MKNPMWSFTLIAALCLALLPAQNIGTDPKPRRTEAVAQPSMMEEWQYAVLSFFGL